MDLTHLVFTVDDTSYKGSAYACAHQRLDKHVLLLLETVCPNQAGKKVSLGAFV